MSQSDSVNPKSADKKVKKPSFGSYLRAIEADRFNAANTSDKEAPLLLKKRIKESDQSKTDVRLIQATGVLISAIWLAGAAFYVQRTVGWSNVSSLMPHELGGFMAGILTPIALFWMIAAFILRSNDVKIYAEALREEIQRMIFPSEETDRRVNNDIERLMRQTEQMSKATRVMLTSIAEAREGLKSQIGALNGAADQTLDRLGRLGTSLSDRTKEVTSVSNTLNQTITHFNQHQVNTTQWIDKLKSANEQIGTQANLVNQSTANVENSVSRLSGMLRERLESLGSIQEKTEVALKKASAEMATQRDLLRVEADMIEEKAYSVSEALEKGVNKLYQFTDDALDKAKLIETRVTGNATSLEQILKLAANGAQAIESKTALAVSRLENAKNAASASSEKLETVLQQAIDRLTERSEFALHQAKNVMTEATGRLVEDVDAVSEKAKTISTDMLNEVSRKVADTSAAFVYIQKQIQSLVTLFDQRKAHLDEAGAGASRTAENLQKSLETALEKVRDMSGALQDSIANIDTSMQKPVALLESAVSNVYLRASDMGDLLQLKTNMLTDSAAKIGANVTAVHDKLQSKGQEVALLAGKIASHLETVTSQLESQNQSLDDKTKRSLENLQNLSIIQNNLIADMGKLETHSQATKQNIETLQQYHADLTDDAAKTETRMGQWSDRMIQVSAATVDKVKSTLENLTLLEADYHRLSDSSIDNINRVGSSFKQTLDTAKAETTKASESLGAIQQQLQSQADATRHIVQQGALKISESAQAITQASDITVSKINKVQEATQGIENSLQSIHQAAQVFDDRVAKGNEVVSGHVKNLTESVMRLEDVTRNVVGAIAEQGQSLENQTELHVNNLQRSFDHASSFTLRLRDYLGQLRTDSEGLEASLSQSVTRLLSHGNQIDTSTTALIEKIGQAQTDLVQYGRNISVTGDTLLTNLRNATQHIGDKATALEQAAVMAQKQAEELRAQESKMKRDAFFSSTKFVVESLHSLALDFTRLLNGELDEKTWKAYQKGDTGSFTRRLLSARDEDTQNKIKNKFNDDHEFRTYVQRYLRQFEEIYDQAAANDHADLLVSVFSTSDVGKLYKFLCAILERDARGDKIAKAA